MPTPKPRRQPAKPKSAKPPAHLKIPGTFNQLIDRSVTAKKPAGGWPKPAK